MRRWSWLRRSRASHVLAGAALGAVVVLAVVSVVGAGPGEHREGVKLVGQYRIEVINAGGALVAVREGHNALTIFGKDDIARCLSGVSTANCYTTNTPPGISARIIVGTGACNTGGIGSAFSFETATNTLVLDAATQRATGWRASATIPIAASATLTEAGVNFIRPTPSVGVGYATDNCLAISPALSVAPGDSVIISITFTVN